MDFALILFIALVLTGVVALWDRLLGSGKRANSPGTGRSSGSDIGRLAQKKKRARRLSLNTHGHFSP